MAERNNFNQVFVRLKAIFGPYAKKMDVTHDTDSYYLLNTRHIMKNKQPLCFGGVRCDFTHKFAATASLWFQFTTGKLMVLERPIVPPRRL